MGEPEYVPALISDHALAVELAHRMMPDEVVITTAPEIFMNHGKHAVNGYYAAARELPLDRPRRYRRILYYAGAQTNVVNGPEWSVDRWIKSHYELRLIESKQSTRSGSPGLRFQRSRTIG